MISDLQESLRACFQAGQPLLAIRSFEEARAIAEITAAAEAEGRDVHVARAPRDPASLLQTIQESTLKDAPGVTILVDPHPWLHDANVVRALRERTPTLESSGRSLVLVAPVLEVPVELRRDLVIFDLPFPSASLIREVALDAFGEGPGDALLDAAARAARGMTQNECRRLFRRMAARGGLTGSDDLAAIVEEKRRLLRMSDLVDLSEAAAGLGDVGGMDALKLWLTQRARAFGGEAREFGLPAPRGLLLLGVQGCGKSLTAKAVASHWGLPLARFDLAQLFRRSSRPEEALRQVLRMSEALAPLILWIDEIDKAFGGVGTGASEELQRVFGTFITWMAEKQEPVFVVATANSVGRLPPELLRKGRFDEIFFVDLPDRAERNAIFRIHVEAHDRSADDFDLEELAQRSEHFSGAEIAQCVVEGLYDAFAEDRELVQTDMLRAITETVPLARTHEESIKALREWAHGRARMASSDASLLELFGTARDSGN